VPRDECEMMLQMPVFSEDRNEDVTMAQMEGIAPGVKIDLVMEAAGSGTLEGLHQGPENSKARWNEGSILKSSAGWMHGALRDSGVSGEQAFGRVSVVQVEGRFGRRFVLGSSRA
jgi:hypothetical protein